MAIFKVKGRPKSSLMIGASSRPPGTAREPFYSLNQLLNEHSHPDLCRTGAQKSSCISTTISAGWKAAASPMIAATFPSIVKCIIQFTIVQFYLGRCSRLPKSY